MVCVVYICLEESQYSKINFTLKAEYWIYGEEK